MFVLIPAIIAALLAGAEQEEERLRRLAVLGQRESGRDGGGRGGGVAPVFLPIWLWPDGGGIWTPVNPEALAVVMGKVVRGGLLDRHQEAEYLYDLDPRQYLEGGRYHCSSPDWGTSGPLRCAIGMSVMLYAYVESGRVVLPFAVADSGDAQFDEGEGGDASLTASLRVRLFLSRVYPSVDLDDRKVQASQFIVSDGVLDVLDRLEGGADPIDIRQQVEELGRDGSRDVEFWVRDYALLRQAVLELEGESGLVGTLSMMDPEEFLSYLEEVGYPEEEVAELTAELGGGDRSRWDPWPRRLRELHSAFVDDLMREVQSSIGAVARAAYEEADRASALVQNSGVERERCDNCRPDSSESWSVRWGWMSRYDEPEDTVVLKFSDDDGAPTWSCQERNTRGSPVGLLATLAAARLLMPEAQVVEIAGDPTWKFPGPLAGEWEFLSLTGAFTPDGSEDGPLIWKIAADHGLLPGDVAAAWAPVFAEMPDATDVLRRKRLLEE